jgi:Uncharacterized protein conserved in bacteria (DUF2330)
MTNWACRLAVMSGVWMCSSVPAASACGGGGVASSSGVVMGSQRIIMSVRAGGTTDMIAQVTVPQTTADYGVLIPVPSEPTLDKRPVSSAELDALDRDTAPRIEIDSGSSSGSGCGCLAAGSAGDTKGGVTVSDSVNIGPLVAVSLTGDNADAVGAWLTEHGFLLPSSDAETLARYVSAGSYFIAIRRSESAASGGPSSVGVHYTLQGDHRKLSLGFTKIGAPPVLAFTLFIAAPQAIGPSAPFAALTLNDLDASMLQSNAYKDTVRVAVGLRDAKAFVLEGTTLKSSVAQYAPSIAQFMDDGAVITRATTVVARSQLSDDVAFATPFSGNIPNHRSASLSALGARYASFGSLGIVLVAHALRRRVRRR